MLLKSFPSSAFPASFRGSRQLASVRNPVQSSIAWFGTNSRKAELFRQARDTFTQAVRADSATDALDTGALQLIADLSRLTDGKVAAVIEANNTAGQTPAPASTSALKSRVLASIERLSRGLLERETEVRLLLLASLCSEHLLLLGPPGTAKSELSRRLNGLVGGAYFERLLTRFSVPEELFGPLSMKGLENDEYVRQTAGYLPTAEVAFIDEIFKANSAILNALLTLLNERLFDNGNQRLEAPLLTLVGASNELPESEELDALFDRFLLRRSVSRVSNGNAGALARLAAGRSAPLTPLAEGGAAAEGLSLDDFKHTAPAAYKAVDVPEAVVELLVELRNWLQDKCEPPVTVSDRRFMKAVQLLQVAAYGDAREEVDEYDVLLLEHVFGNRPDDSVKVRAKVLELISSDPGLQQAEMVLLGLFGRGARLVNAAAGASSSAAGAEAAAELPAAAEEASGLVELLAARHAALAAQLEAPDGGFPSLRRSVWQAPSSAQAAVQTLTPQITENRKKVEELLREAQTLSDCLSRAAQGGVPAGVLEKLLPKRAKQYAKGISQAPQALAGAAAR
ncbi:AAA domain-containing protein [Haematococcus lacustris]